MPKEHLKKLLLEAPIVEFGEYQYFIHPISDGIPLVTRELMEETVEEILAVGNFDCDKILVVEAMGMHLGAGLCLKTGLPFVVARKRPYGLEDEIAFNQTTGYHTKMVYVNNIRKGDRLTIVDDVLSTGGTLKGLLRTLADIGAEVVDIVIIFDKGDCKKEIEEEFGVTVKSLLRVKVVDGKVVILE